MPVIAGIDEVGYGPRLGPLVVCAYAFRAPRASLDLWRAIALPAPLAVADSKRLYSPARGIGALEPTALAFLSLLPRMDARSLKSVVRRVALGEDRALLGSPWYEEDLPLPVASAPADAPAELWRACERAAVLPLGCWASWSEPAPFNASLLNKSDFLFDRACDLVKAVLDAAPDEEAAVFAGKQGGRRFYLPGLVREFGSVWIEEETRETSRYAFERGGRRVRVSFLIDGEDRHFAIALASIVGKYLRECAMLRFNAWWGARKPGLRPTAGYGPDGSRFFREVEPDLGRLALTRDQVLRRR